MKDAPKVHYATWDREVMACGKGIRAVWCRVHTNPTRTTCKGCRRTREHAESMERYRVNPWDGG
jgi:hypothetical protein